MLCSMDFSKILRFVLLCITFEATYAALTKCGNVQFTSMETTKWYTAHPKGCDNIGCAGIVPAPSGVTYAAKVFLSGSYSYHCVARIPCNCPGEYTYQRCSSHNTWGYINLSNEENCNYQDCPDVNISRIDPSSENVLNELYNTTGGNMWTNSFGWNPVNTSAYGVTFMCDPSAIYVKKINLANNGLSGTIPDLGMLSKLNVLDLANNGLSGTIPDDLGMLSKLNVLNLANNGLSGTIPDLRMLLELNLLNLANNGLSGTIPDLEMLSKLNVLNLANNGLSGTIPDLEMLSELNLLNLANNGLSGTIPHLGMLSELNLLNLANNGLSGTIPDLGMLSKLKFLNLAKNSLNGSIPSTLNDSSKLRQLRLQQNQLEGSIPDFLGGLGSINYINFHGNKLSGEVPYSWNNLWRMRHATIKLRGNNLYCPRTNADYDALVRIMDDFGNSEMTGCRCQPLSPPHSNYSTQLYLGTYVIGTNVSIMCNPTQYNTRTCDTDDSQVAPAGWDNPCY